MSKLTDESFMPWGKYRGMKLGLIPASYFLFLWEENKCHGEVYDYVKENLDVLKQQANGNQQILSKR